MRKDRNKQAASSHPANDFPYAQNLLERDVQYVDLLKHFVVNQKRADMAQLIFKVIFFALVCVVFLGVVAVGCFAIYYIARKDVISWQDFGAALTGLGGILGVIIVLPSKIAEHLFPAGGSKDSMDFVTAMQAYDLERKPQEDGDPADYVIEVSNAPAPDKSEMPVTEK